jgi:predicted dehydrogenase
VWQGIGHAKVTAVCDAVRDRAASVAGEVGAEPFVDVEEMAASGMADALDICTPSGLHARQGLVGAKHGLHVLCEKPLDLKADVARQLVEECEARGLKLGCVLQRRTYAAARSVATAVHEGKLGIILSASAYVKWWRDQDYYDSSGWRGTRVLDGGVLANQGIHALDHLCWLAGPVVKVEYAHAATAGHRMEAEDFLIAVVMFASGARGVIEATTCSNPPLCTRVEVVGTNGAAAFDDAEVVQFGYQGCDRMAELPGEPAKLGGRAEAMDINLQGHAAVLSDFAAAILEDRPPVVTGRDALVSVEALNAIYRAAGVME